MITKSKSSDYYVIDKQNLKTKKKERVKSNIKDKYTAKSEIEKLAKKLGETLSDSGYFSHNGYYYGVSVSNKELDK